MPWNPKLKAARRKLDTRLAALKPVDRLQPPPKGWIRSLRNALGMSSAQLGTLLKIRSQSVDDMETNEANGTIRLETLRRVAQALDCTLVYALVPNASLDQLVATRAHVIAANAISVVDHTMALEDQVVPTEGRAESIDDYIRSYISERDLWSDF